MIECETDARDCGRFARALTAEAFKRRSLEAMRDHDELVLHWRDRAGFMDGYTEGTPC